MSEDMSDLFKKFSEMVNNNEVPDNIKSALNGFNSNSNNSDNSSNISPEMISNLANMFSQNNKSSNEDNSSNSSSGIDFETIMKMKSIMEKMNSKNDPRAKLLLSLKPYLKDSRKNKVDQYIQLLNLTNVMDIFPKTGGEKK